MATKFAEEVNLHLMCPKCRNLFDEPALNIHCGHTFCKKCFLQDDNKEESSSQAKCPVDNVACAVNSLILNRALLSQIHDLRIYCENGLKWNDEENSWTIDSSGCPEQIKLGDRRAHEDICEHAKEPCPFNFSICGYFQRRFLKHHIQGCQNVPCTYSNKGCSFLGSTVETRTHEQDCDFREHNLLPDIVMLQTLHEKNKELEKTVLELRQQVTLLQGQTQTLQTQVDTQNRTVSSLVTRLDQLNAEVNQIKLLARVHPTESNSAIRRRTSSSSSLSAPRLSSPRAESWTMPFQFKCIGTLRGHQEMVRYLIRWRNLLLSCSDDCLIKVWDLDTLTHGCVKTLNTESEVQVLAAGAEHVYSGGQDGSLRVWSVPDLQLIHVAKEAHINVVAALICSDDYLISSSHTVIKIWRVGANLEPVHTIKGLHHWVRSLAFSNSQDRFYSGTHNNIEIWDCTGSFNLVGKISHTYGSVHSLCVTQQYIIAGTYNQNLHVFDVKTQTYLKKLSGHLGIITCVCTSLSGRYMFTSSKDKSVQIWDLENFLPIQNLQRHEGGVNSLLLHHDLLLSGSDDKEIKVFKYFKMQPGFIPS